MTIASKSKSQYSANGAKVRLNTALVKGIAGQIDIDASVRIFLQHPNLPDEEAKCPKEEIKIEGLPNQILRMEIGTSIFDQD